MTNSELFRYINHLNRRIIQLEERVYDIEDILVEMRASREEKKEGRK